MLPLAKRHAPVAWVLALALGFGLWPDDRACAGTQVVTLIPSADTGLYQVAPTNNLGLSTAPPIGIHSNGTESRYLLQFDIASRLPPSAIILDARLALRVIAANPPSPYHVQRMLRPWTEGSQPGRNGSPAAEGETTWLAAFHPSNLWTTPGGAPGSDYATNPSATTILGDSSDPNTFSGPDLAADVQLWLHQPSSNHGWMILVSRIGSAHFTRRIGSRENDGNVPVLTLRYCLPPCLQNPRYNVEDQTFSFEVRPLPNQPLRIEFKDLLAPGPWQPLTNLPAVPSSDPILLFDSDLGTPASFSRFYRTRFEDYIGTFEPPPLWQPPP